MEIFWILLIVLIASLVKGITGFGFALVSLPLLINWYSPKELIPVLILCNLFVSTVIVLQKKDEKLVNRQFRSFIIFGGLFTLFGVIVLKNMPEEMLIRTLSIILIVLSVISLLGIKYSLKLTDTAYKVAGAFLGFLTGSTSISGPPMALFLHSANVNNKEFREIFAWFSIVTTVIALGGYAFFGLLTLQTFKMAGMFLPILYFGTYFGKRLNHRIPISVFKQSILIITLFSSIMLLLR